MSAPRNNNMLIHPFAEKNAALILLMLSAEIIECCQNKRKNIRMQAIVQAWDQSKADPKRKNRIAARKCNMRDDNTAFSAP